MITPGAPVPGMIMAPSSGVSLAARVGHRRSPPPPLKIVSNYNVYIFFHPSSKAINSLPFPDPPLQTRFAGLSTRGSFGDSL